MATRHIPNIKPTDNMMSSLYTYVHKYIAVVLYGSCSHIHALRCVKPPTKCFPLYSCICICCICIIMHMHTAWTLLASYIIVYVRTGMLLKMIYKLIKYLTPHIYTCISSLQSLLATCIIKERARCLRTGCMIGLARPRTMLYNYDSGLVVRMAYTTASNQSPGSCMHRQFPF